MLHPPQDMDPTALIRLRDGIYAADLLIAAVAELDLFSTLAPRSHDLGELCATLGLAARPADVMLTLFCAQKLLSRTGDRFELTPLARAHLVRGAPHDLGPYFASLRARPTCQELLSVLRTDRPAGWASKSDGRAWSQAMADLDFARSFTAAMDSRGNVLADAAAAALDCAADSSLLDVAGGSGAFACAFALRHPHLRVAVLEKPPVDQVARLLIAERGLTDRVAALAGDIFEGLPAGFDVHLFSHVLHDWDAPQVKRLLARSFASLPSHGRIAILDAHLDADKTGPLPVAEYSVLLMCSTEGRCYSSGELSDWLGAAGFAEPAIVPLVANRSIITARKLR